MPYLDKPYHLDSVFEKHLGPIYDRLSDPTLLARCLPGYTQNANESINALVWARCPSHNWHGRKRIEMATALATLHFSSGASAKHNLMVQRGLAVGCHTRKESSRLIKVFQRQDVILTHVEPMVRPTITALEKLLAEPEIQLKKVNVVCIDLSTHQISAIVSGRESFDENIHLKFLSNIISHIQQRFQDNRIVSALSALDPSNMPESDFIYYGEEEMQTLAHHFQLDSDTIFSSLINNL